MDLPTITMDRTKAREAFLEYRDAVRARHSAEDAAIMRGYRTLSRGHQIINLREAISRGGLNDQHLPALAVGRADRQWAWLKTGRDGSVAYYHKNPDAWGERISPNAGPAAGTWKFPTGTLPAVAATQWDQYRAMMPIIPPALRPAHALSGYAILWEVEKWEKVPRPPGDPALLKWLGGELYAVLAVWDLTDIERAVLAGRTP